MVEELSFNKEHAWWLNDILQDYEAMIITANNTIAEMRKQWEEILKASDPKEAKELAEKMETLKRDEWHVKIAELRYKELQDKVWKFLWITLKDVENLKTDWTLGTDISWEEQIHSADEDTSSVQWSEDEVTE